MIKVGKIVVHTSISGVQSCHTTLYFKQTASYPQTDCLSVCVGLTNVFVLQFVVVVLLFFATREIDLDTGTLEDYYPGRYHGSAT